MKHPPRNIDLTCYSWVKLILKTDLPSNAKYIALYLSTYMNLNQDVAFPSLARIEGETSLSHPSVLKYLNILVSEGWLVKQSGDRVNSNRYWVNIPDTTAAEVGNLDVGKETTYVTSLTKVGKEVTSNINRISKEYIYTDQRKMKKPTQQEVVDYCTTKGYTFDPIAFHSHYESNGWRVGRNPMKSWHSACVTWQRNEGKRHENSNRPDWQPANQRRLSRGDEVRAAREAARIRQARHSS